MYSIMQSRLVSPPAYTLSKDKLPKGYTRLNQKPLIAIVALECCTGKIGCCQRRPKQINSTHFIINYDK